MKSAIKLGLSRVGVPALSLVLALAFATPAYADDSSRGFDVSLGLTHSLARADSINAIADHDSLAMSHMSASARLGELDGVQLAVEAGFEIGTLDGETFQQIETSLLVSRLSVGLRGTYPLTSHISAFSRATTGIEWGTLSLSDPRSGADPIQDGARAATASVFGGGELSFSNGSGPVVRVGFALRLEVGYTRSTSLGFAAQPAEDPGDVIEISTVSARLGELNTSGYGYRVSLVMKF